ncbi:MAG: hypothetical protein ACI4WS_13830 [Oscillospiraceae bacterium]
MAGNVTIEMSSTALELSEHPNYIELTNRLCYYGEPNLNDVELPAETAEKYAQSLVLQPVVAKYKVISGKPDLGGHEARVGSDGKVTFGTESVGVHESVEVKTDSVTVRGETKTLPCLFAKSRIWTRNENVVAAVKRLFSEGRLHSSWELLVSDYEYKDGIKVLKDYTFTSNALLGTNSSPAYGDAASALVMAEAEDQPEYIIAEALAKDLGIKEEDNLATENEGTQTTETTPEVTVSEPDVTNTISELSVKIGELTQSVAERDAALATANEKLSAANARIAELEKVEKLYNDIMTEKQKEEEEAARCGMRDKIKKSGLFSDDEIEKSEELKAIMEKADMNALMSVIAERFMKSLEKPEPTPEVSEVKPEQPKADVSEDDHIDNKKFMAALLG